MDSGWCPPMAAEAAEPLSSGTVPRLLQLEGRVLKHGTQLAAVIRLKESNFSRRERGRIVACYTPVEASVAIEQGDLPPVTEDDSGKPSQRPAPGQPCVAYVFVSKEDTRALVMYKAAEESDSESWKKAMVLADTSFKVNRLLEGDRQLDQRRGGGSSSMPAQLTWRPSMPLPSRQPAARIAAPAASAEHDGASSVNSCTGCLAAATTVATQIVLMREGMVPHAAKRITDEAQRIASQFAADHVHRDRDEDPFGPARAAVAVSTEAPLTNDDSPLLITGSISDNEMLAALADDDDSSLCSGSSGSAASSRQAASILSGLSSRPAAAPRKRTAAEAADGNEFDIDATNSMCNVGHSAVQPCALRALELRKSFGRPSDWKSLRAWATLSEGGDQRDLRFLFVHDRDGAVVAFASFVVRRMWHGRTAAFIWDIRVQDHLRRKGVGIVMVNLLFTVAPLAGCDVLAASCLCSNGIGCRFWIHKMQFCVAVHGFAGMPEDAHASLDLFKPLVDGVDILRLPRYEIKHSEPVYQSLLGPPFNKTEEYARTRCLGYFVTEDVHAGALITKWHLGMPHEHMFPSADAFEAARGKHLDYVAVVSKNGRRLDARSCDPGRINTAVGLRGIPNNASYCPSPFEGTVNVRARVFIAAGTEVFMPYSKRSSQMDTSDA